MAAVIPDGITAEDIFQAIADYERGTTHGFGESTKYDLVLEDGRRFPPKAIIGLAARRLAGRALHWDEFPGGLSSKCVRILRRHGFNVSPKNAGPLVVGGTYSRADVAAAVAPGEDWTKGDGATGHHRHRGDWYVFANVGAAGRTGHDYANRWLNDTDFFWLTKNTVAADSPTFRSLVDGDGRVHLFTRGEDRAPFTYHGTARAVSFRGSNPVEIVWRVGERASPTLEPDEAGTEPPAYLPTEGDSRERVNRQIAARRGQKQFRDALVVRYGGACMITGCRVLSVVEAAHIRPYRGEGDNHVANGLLLRSDLHTLFDLDLLGIEPETLTIRLQPDARRDGYEVWDGVQLRCDGPNRPSEEALRWRWEEFSADA